MKKHGVTIPVVVRLQERNSLNNRYLIPPSDIPTECVVAVDDDDLFGATDLSAAKAAWSHAPARLVGLSTYMRTHLVEAKTGLFRYSLTMGAGMPASMLLNSGIVYSRHVHTMYASEALEEARAVVGEWVCLCAGVCGCVCECG